MSTFAPAPAVELTSPSSERAHDVGGNEPGATLVQLLRAQLERDPSAAAVIADGETLDRAALWSAAAATATALLDCGARPGDLVGLYLHPGPDAVIAAWGALLAGCAYVPISPDYPLERVRYMIGDARVELAVALLDDEPDLMDLDPRLTVVSPCRASGPAGGAIVEPRPADGAYAIYTSGSTGRPKGVLIEHGAIATQLTTLHTLGWLTGSTRILQKTPLSFDAAQWELLATAVGATVVCSGRDTYRSPADVIERVRRFEVTALQCVPTLWDALVRTPGLTTCTPLRHAFSGGEALTRELADRVTAALPDVTLVNLYGPTEVTINATAHVVEPAGDDPSPVVAIGRPLPGVIAHILDAAGGEVSDGDIGELHLGGPQLARGYLGRPDLTAERFPVLSTSSGRPTRLYRTGDLVSGRADGSLRFHGRSDHQVKINGHRIELDEVAETVRRHHWVDDVAVVPWHHPVTDAPQLAAFVQLDPDQAALMDQGEHGGHHVTKSTHVQVRAQLGGQAERRDLPDAPTTALTGADGSGLAAAAYRRKTYRNYRGDSRNSSDVFTWLAQPDVVAPSGPVVELNRLDGLARLLRWFGPFPSRDRLLPKYSYASPGALNATHIYVDAVGIADLADGLHYFRPTQHELVRIGPAVSTEPALRLHLVGSRDAIRSVYSTNVDEVLYFEAGHMLGALDQFIHPLGLRAVPAPQRPVADFGLFEQHRYLAGVDLVHAVDAPAAAERDGSVTIHVQHAGRRLAGLEPGLFEVTADGPRARSTELIRRCDVIAINQSVYDTSHFGVLLTVPRSRQWNGLVDLGRMLHQLQCNDRGIGLMSSGYSSLTGSDLPSARRYRELTGDDALTYFALAGPVTAAQESARDMTEDTVHMRGPAEILRDDMARFLPAHMMPTVVEIVSGIPTTANGKRDVVRLRELAAATVRQRTHVAPANDVEREVIAIWSEILNASDASMSDNFFAQGGNSLTAVMLVGQLNGRLGADLPVQAVFDAATPRELAALVGNLASQTVNRLIRLDTGPEPAGERPYFAWPGLGGFPLNLRELADHLGDGRAVFGVQAIGINSGELPHARVEDMAAEDLSLIRRRQPDGPYRLLGYSFGCRVAFEVARRLEAAGERVDALTLIAPGSPRTRWSDHPSATTGARYDNPYYVQILTSVFTRSTDDEQLIERALAHAPSREQYVRFISSHTGLPAGLVAGIVRVVEATFAPEYRFTELEGAQLRAPIAILCGRDDDYSFLDNAGEFAVRAPVRRTLEHDHFALLRGDGAADLAQAVIATGPPRPGDVMPHISIKHFPVQLDTQTRSNLVAELTDAVTKAFRCSADAISIAHEAIAPETWRDAVYVPEIDSRPELLLKTPNYRVA